MTKAKMVKKQIQTELSKIFGETYGVKEFPTTDAQEKLVKKTAEYVYKTYAKKLTAKELKK